MSGPSPDDVRIFVTKYLNQKVSGRARGLLNNLPDDCDLLLLGLLDSLMFVEMMVAIGEHFNWEIDFEGLDPEKLMVVGPLCEFVSERLRELA